MPVVNGDLIVRDADPRQPPRRLKARIESAHK